MRRVSRTWFLGLLLFCAAAGWAQSIVGGSLTSTATFGLFGAPLDAATRVTEARREPTFSTLPHNYFFGSLANVYNLTTGGFFTGVPVALGYYQSSATPWCLFGSALADAQASGRADGITSTTVAYELVNGHQVPWITDTTELTHTSLSTWSVDAAAQFLIHAGSVNLGVIPMFTYETDVGDAGATAWADANRTRVVTFYYNTAASGEDPRPEENGRVTTASRAPDSAMSLALGVPFYVPLGGAGLELYAEVSYDRRDESTSLTNEITPPQQPGAVALDDVLVEDSESNMTSGFDMDLNATLSFGPLFGGQGDNRLNLAFSGSLGSDARGQRVLVYREQDYTAAGGGAPLVEAHTGTDPVFTEDTYTFLPTFRYEAALSAQPFLYRDLGEAVVIGTAPRLTAGFGYTPLVRVYDVERVNVSRDDGDDDGLFVSPADTITTTTTDYYGNEDGGSFWVTGGVALPAAVRFRPGQGMLAIAVGGEIGVDLTWTQVKDTPTTARQAITAVDGTGADVTLPVAFVDAPPSYEAVETSLSWSFRAEYGLAFTFLLPEGGHVDLAVLGSLPFDRIEVQCAIPIL